MFREDEMVQLTSRNRRKWSIESTGVVIGLVVGALLTAVVAAVFVRGSDDIIYATGEPANVAADLTDLVAQSELVVSGTVAERRPGRVVGEDLDPQETHEQLRLDEIVLKVDKVLAGDGVQPGDVVIYEEVVGFVDDDRTLVFAGAADAAKPGDSGIYFLLREEPDMRMRLTTPDGRLLVADNGKRFEGQPTITNAVGSLLVSTPEEVEARVIALADIVGTRSLQLQLEE